MSIYTKPTGKRQPVEICLLIKLRFATAVPNEISYIKQQMLVRPCGTRHPFEKTLVIPGISRNIHYIQTHSLTNPDKVLLLNALL